MARIDEWGITAGLTTVGAVSLQQGVKYWNSANINMNEVHENLEMNSPKLAKFVKRYPKVLEVAKHYPKFLGSLGAVGVVAGAAGLAWCIFDEVNKKN